MAGRVLLAAGALLALSGCAGWQNMLDTASADSSHVAWLTILFTILLVVIWAAVMVAVFVARRGRPGRELHDPLTIDPGFDRRTGYVVGSLVAATLVVVLVLTGLSYAGQRRLFGPREEAVTIRVTGHQWWWEVRYESQDSSRSFTTANEIHIPVGQPVNFKLNSSDVIHSFWVPSLTGKLDAITGRENQLRVTAERPGVYRGQCAEFCGLQHAHMGILVVAESQEEFERWRDGQIAQARQPEDDERRQGLAAFAAGPCAMCHTIRGTNAGGKIAPDLTHVGSRRYLAAGALPMSRGNLAAWIVDPHSIKPGVNMPTIKLSPDELNAISAYLESLK
ncbi:MAG: cytochrome c oxidase, subunit [Enterovirga sp.]|jgi:cytochrome c oxidase subunit 2|nr:cytochrome c oxidase, subunit [Enterovirga sp.]